MITLKISEPGHTVAIPGLKVFRTPATIDISKLDIRIVSMYLKTSGIEKYEITAKTQDKKEVYTKKDFDEVEKKKPKQKQKVNPSRIDRIEKMLEVLVTQQVSNLDPEKEQINKKLDRLERLMKSKGMTQVTRDSKTKKSMADIEPEIEELEAFIPEIDVSDMKIKSDIKTVKQDDDSLEDTADLLSGLIKK